MRDLHVRELDLSGTKPFLDGVSCASRTAHARRRVPFRNTPHNVLQPNNVATADCLRGAGLRVKPGTRAWDGLLEALSANLIAALFLRGMYVLTCCFACTAPPRCTNQHHAANPLGGSYLRLRERSDASGWCFWSARRARVWAASAASCACAGNGIEAEGAVALAAALQDNTTLQTLDLSSMWIARKRVFGGE